MSSEFDTEKSNQVVDNPNVVEQPVAAPMPEPASEVDTDGGHCNDLKPQAVRSSLPLSVDSIHDAIGDVAYEWDIATDQLKMSDNACDVFDFSDDIFYTNGLGFASCQDYSNNTSRYATVFDGSEVDHGLGVPFQIEYLIKPHGRSEDTSIWVEDTGRWYAGADGAPAKVVGIMRRSDSRYAREQAQKYMSQFDADTGLVNRNMLEGELERVFTVSSASGEEFTFCLAAIDDLSVLNESYGYEVADQIIPIVANRLRSVMRSGDMIGRYAGNKFGIILNNCDEEEISVASMRLLQSVCSEPVETMAGAISVKISVGSVVCPGEISDSKKARYAAEQALREAKSSLTENFVNYRPSPEQESERRKNIVFVDEMLQALNDRRLFLTYQPIVDAFSLQPVYHECLLRMTNTAQEEVDAGYFIPLCETLGLSDLIDQRVLEMAMATLNEAKNSKLAINISGNTVVNREWLDALLSFLAQDSSLAKRTLIEITETVALNDVKETRDFIAKLHEHGCEVAIDDFGAGYTSFKNLIDLDVDLVKIDGHFVENMATSPDNQLFVRTLVELAKNFNMRIVAEWVTDQASADLLRAWGVDYFQGNVFGTPQKVLAMPAQSEESPAHKA